MKRAAVAAAILLTAGIAGWQGLEALQTSDPQTPALPLDSKGATPKAPAKTPAAAKPAAASSGGKSGDAATSDQLSRTETPMAERVAVLGLLNKRNGQERDLTLKPGQAMKVGDVVVRLRACETTGDWEAEKLTGAFVQMDVQGRDARWRRAFSGWLYKETPSLNVVEHPIYDVWPKSCAMTHPDIGPDTLVASQVATSGAVRSKAKKSPDSDGPAAEPAAAATPTPSASSNSTR